VAGSEDTNASTQKQHETCHNHPWLRLEYAIEKPSNNPLAATELDSDT
jgi:hypothetical protein